MLVISENLRLGKAGSTPMPSKFELVVSGPVALAVSGAVWEPAVVHVGDMES